MRPIDLYLPVKQPKAAVSHHLLDLIAWNGASDAFRPRVKPSKVRGGFYPLHAANAYQLSRKLSAIKGGGRVAYDDLDRNAWREIEALGGTLLLTLPIEMLFPRPEMAQGILDGLEEAGLDPARVAILNNNLNAPQWHADHWRALGAARTPRIIAFNGCYWMLRGGEASLPDSAGRAAAREARWRATLGHPRGRRFVSFNGRLRPLRSHLVLWLAANGWLDEGHVSLIGYGVPAEETSRRIADWSRKYPEGDAISAALPDLMARMPLTIDFDRAQAETDGAYKRLLPWTGPAPEPYDDSWFSIVVDTVQSDDALFVTEKAFKSFLNFHPFVYFGNPGALAEMRRMGFQTFAPFIDEAYDEERSAKKRLEMAMAQVRRLMEMPAGELRAIYEALGDHLQHNYRHLHRDGRSEFLATLRGGLQPPRTPSGVDLAG